MNRYLPRLIPALVLVITLAGCGAGTAVPSPAPSSPPLTLPTTPIATPTTPAATPTAQPVVITPPTATPRISDPLPTKDAGTSGPTGEVPTEIMEQILDDLEQRSGIPRERIVEVVGEAVEWPDAALGCPRPGQMYPQVITPGYRIVLRIGDVEYDYRASERGFFLLCTPTDPTFGLVPDQPVQETTMSRDPQSAPKPTSQATPTSALQGSAPVSPQPPATVSRTLITPPYPAFIEERIATAKNDLAGRLGLSLDQIEVVEVLAVVWADGSLGCPQPGVAYIQVLTDGMQIVLRAGGALYSYHSAGEGQPRLCEQ